jgi:hypothetical protein
MLQKWLKMVFIPLLGFGGSFEAYVLLAFTSMPWRSKRARRGLNVPWENPTFAGSAGAPMICHLSKWPNLPVKQAQIEPKKAKEELRPFYTNFATP